MEEKQCCYRGCSLSGVMPEERNNEKNEEHMTAVTSNITDLWIHTCHCGVRQGGQMAREVSFMGTPGLISRAFNIQLVAREIVTT